MSRAEPGRPQLHLHAWKGGVMAMEKGRCLEGPSVLVGPAFGHEKKGQPAPGGSLHTGVAVGTLVAAVNPPVVWVMFSNGITSLSHTGQPPVNLWFTELV